MGKLAKKAGSGIANTIKNAPKTIAETTKNVVSSMGNAGKALVGANGGNYFKDLGSAATQAGVSAANALLTTGAGGVPFAGATSLNPGGNSLDTQAANLMGKKDETISMPGDVDVSGVTEDPNLTAEKENAKRKGRAANILGGASDKLSATSAKKSLLAL